MTILYDNRLEGLIPGAPPALPSFADLDDLYTQVLADSVRFSATNSIIIEYDLGDSPDAYDGFSLCGHNIQDSATVTAYTGDSPGFAVPNNTIAMSGSPQRYGKAADTISDRYVRFEIEDGTNPAGFIQIGRLFVDAVYTFPSFAPTVTADKLIRGTASRSQSDQVYGEQRYTVNRLSLEFPNIGVNQKKAIDAFLDKIGFSKCFIIHLDECGFDFDFDTLHVQRDGDAQSFELNTARIWTTRLDLLEAF